MHTFHCLCGRAIEVDPPSKCAGYLVWDADADSSIENRRQAIHAFLTAVSTGRRDCWLRYFYGTDPENRFQAKTDADVIEDILSKHDSYTRVCYRCDGCGRLYVQSSSGCSHYDAYHLDQT
jgi:hypothetical protein